MAYKINKVCVYIYIRYGSVSVYVKYDSVSVYVKNMTVRLSALCTN